MNPLRAPTTQEQRMLARLIKKAKVSISRDWNADLQVRTMNDGGMGSLQLFAQGMSPDDHRRFGKCASAIRFTDQDGVAVIASLYLDQAGNLFEMDVWKTDFSKLIRFPAD